jgi:hypothetical protein
MKTAAKTSADKARSASTGTVDTRPAPSRKKKPPGRLLLAPVLQGPPGAPPEVELVTAPGSEAFQKAWQVLAAESADDNPFLAPMFLIPAAVHLAMDSPLTLAAVWQQEPSRRRLTALIPMTAPRRPLLRSLFDGGHAALWAHPLLPFCAPLLSPDRSVAEASVAAFFDWITARRQRLATMTIPSLLRGSTASEIFGNECARHGFAIDRKRDLAHTRGLDFKPSAAPACVSSVVVARSGSAVRKALEAALCLDMRAVEAGSGQSPLLSDLNRCAFLRAVVRNCAMEDRMVIATFQDGDDASAAAMVIEGRDSAFLWWIMGKDAANPLIEAALAAAVEEALGKPIIAATEGPVSGLWARPIVTETLVVRLGRSATAVQAAAE